MIHDHSRVSKTGAALLLILLAGCSAPIGVATPAPIRTPSPLPSQTPVPVQTAGPTLTGAPAPSWPPTASSAPTRPFGSDNPLLPGPISAENAKQILQMAQWGKGAARALQYAPDGRQFALLTSVGVYLYETETFTQIRFFPAQAASYTAALSPDWETLAWGQGNRIGLLDLSSGTQLGSFESGAGTITGLRFSPGTDLLAVKVHPPGEEVHRDRIELRSTADGSLQKSWDLLGVEWAFSSDWSSLASWDSQAGIGLWQLPGGDPLPFPGEVATPTVAAFSPQGDILATASAAEPFVQLWQVSDGSPLSQVQTGRGAASLTFSPDGTRLVVVSEDGFAGLWDLTTGRQTDDLLASPAPPGLAAFSPDGATLALPWYGGARFWDVVSGEPFRHLEEHTGPVGRLALAPQAGLLAALERSPAAESASLRVLRLGDREPLLSIAGLPVLSADLSPDGTRLALGAWDGNVTLRDTAHGIELHRLEGHAAPVQGVAFSPDGSRLASASLQEIRLWSASDGAPLQTLAVPGGWVMQVAFSPDGRLLASLSGDGGVRVWGTADGRLVHTLSGAEAGWNGGLAFSPDGSTLVLANHASILRWRVAGGAALNLLAVSAPGVAALAFTPHGDLLAAGLSDGAIQLWDPAGEKLIHTLSGHTAQVTGLAFSSGGQFLLSGSLDGTLRLWGLTGAR